MSITALTLIRPSVSVTGSISVKNRRTAGSRQSSTSCRRPSSPRSHGSGSSSWISVADEDRARVDVELRVLAVDARHAEREPGDDREVPEHRRQRRDGEVVVGVEDPDDDPREPEQHDDREEHPREPDGEIEVAAGIAERA